MNELMNERTNKPKKEGKREREKERKRERKNERTNERTNEGTKERRNEGTKERRNEGTKERRNEGTKERAREWMVRTVFSLTNETNWGHLLHTGIKIYLSRNTRPCLCRSRCRSNVDCQVLIEGIDRYSTTVASSAHPYHTPTNRF